jgi:DNA-binding beta-propeller fold protein YncE
MFLRQYRVAGALLLALFLAACGGSGDSGDSRPYTPPPMVTTPTTLRTMIALSHNALVYDSTRTRYYASIPGSVATYGNRIAMIDATTGAVTYSAQSVGSQPTALAISADAASLYVALNGSGDVVKLSLADFSEQWRVRLPTDVNYGQLTTEQLAVSPTDPDVIAVSMVRAGVSPKHGGVGLIRNGALQTRLTDPADLSNFITFGADGSTVYALNNDSTGFQLRRISVVADGLQLTQSVTSAADFGARALSWSAQGLLVDKTAYRASDLAQIGAVTVSGGQCKPHSVADRLVCFNSPWNQTTNPSLAIVNATTYVILATPVYLGNATNYIASDIVPGPAGQVALRMNSTYWNSPATAVELFGHPSLE